MNSKLLFLVVLLCMTTFVKNQECAVKLKVESRGFNQGNTFAFKINDVAVDYQPNVESNRNFFRGVCVFQTNSDGDELYKQCFDTWADANESVRLGQYLSSLPNGTLVAFAVKDEATNKLSDATKQEMMKFGFPSGWTFTRSNMYRGSLAAIGYKGSEAGSALFDQKPDGQAQSDLETCLKDAVPEGLQTCFKASSRGFNQGNSFEFQIDGNVVDYQPNVESNRNFFRGVCVLQSNNKGEELYKQCFDTWADANESVRLGEFLSGLPDGALVAFAVKDEATNKLSDATKQEMMKFGLPSGWTFTRSNMYRGSLAFIGFKGSDAGSAVFDQKPDGQAQSDVELCVPKPLENPQQEEGVCITSVSKGFNQGNMFQFRLDDVVVDFQPDTESTAGHFRGICVLETNTSGQQLYKQCYDTHGSNAESDRLRDYLSTLADGSLVAFAVRDEAVHKLKDDCRAEIRKFGLPADWTLNQYRGSFAAIGFKGSEAGSAIFDQKPDGQAVSEVQLCVSVTETTEEVEGGVCVKSTSKGFNQGNSFEFVVNDAVVDFQTATESTAGHFRGICLINFSVDGSVAYKQCYDTHGSNAESDRLRDYLAGLADGSLVAFAVRDEAVHKLKDDCRAEIRKFGLPADWTLNQYRGSFAAVGQKGAEAGSAVFDQQPDGQAVSEVEVCYNTNEEEQDLTGCVIVYSECNFEGDSVAICDEVPVINFEAKSATVPEGIKLTLWEETQFGGLSADFTESFQCNEDLPYSFLQVSKAKSANNLRRNLRKEQSKKHPHHQRHPMRHQRTRHFRRHHRY